MPQDRDGDLFDRWLERRDGDAFAELARRHSAVVYDLAARAVGDRTEAEDVLQEALLDLALARTRKPVEVGIAAWLVRFAVCRARNRRSSLDSRVRRQRIAGARRAEEVMPDDAYELSDELEHVLERAEPEERLVLAMRYLHGWEYPRIASALSVSEGAARVRVHRALSAVRSRVGSSRPGDERRLQQGIAALPVIALESSRLGGILDGVLSTAQTQLTTGAGGAAQVGGTTPAAPGSRFSSFGIRILAGLALVAGGSAPFLAGSARESVATAGHRASLTGGVPLVSTVSASASSSATAGAWRSGSPRPHDWDRGALGRLARGERELEAVGQDRGVAPRPPRTPASEAAGETPPGPEHEPARGLPETSRPTSRGACAARCEPASSDGERTGVSGSPRRSVQLSAAGPYRPATPVLAAPESPVAVNPGATALSVPADYSQTRPETGGRPSMRVADLPPGQRDLVLQAAAFVKELSQAGEQAAGGGDRLARSRRVLRRARGRIQRKYRRARRQMRQAARVNDFLTVEAVAEHAAKLSTASTVLGLLVEASAPTAPPADELRWPDALVGLDVSGTLAGVLDVLATPLPVERLPDLLGDAATGSPVGGTIDPQRLPDALQEGL